MRFFFKEITQEQPTTLTVAVHLLKETRKNMLRTLLKRGQQHFSHVLLMGAVRQTCKSDWPEKICQAH